MSLNTTCTNHKTDGNFCSNCGQTTVINQSAKDKTIESNVRLQHLKDLLNMLQPIISFDDSISFGKHEIKIIAESGLIDVDDFYFIDIQFFKTNHIIRYSDIKKINPDFFEFVDKKTIGDIIAHLEACWSKDHSWVSIMPNVFITNEILNTNTHNCGIHLIKIFDEKINPVLKKMTDCTFGFDIKKKVYDSLKKYYISQID